VAATVGADPVAAEAPQRAFWQATDTVLLDMDGTLLDLAFDNRFWLERVPGPLRRTAGPGLRQALNQLKARMAAVSGQLQWYCLDYWSETWAFDMEAMKRAHQQEIATCPECATSAGTAARKAVATWPSPPMPTRMYSRIKLEQTGLGDWWTPPTAPTNWARPRNRPPSGRPWNAASAIHPAHTLFVDDSLPVLASARDHGIAHLRAIARPASDQPARPSSDFPAVEALPDLGPVPVRD
jgi:5'-nucleotidase